MEDFTQTSVTLNWEEPLSNGGITLTGYSIEKYDLSEKKWVQVGAADPADTSYHVKNLTTSHEYFFRITAENLAGVSPRVETSEPVLLARSKGTFSENACFRFWYLAKLVLNFAVEFVNILFIIYPDITVYIKKKCFLIRYINIFITHTSTFV